jgi:hypothetical protein
MRTKAGERLIGTSAVGIMNAWITTGFGKALFPSWQGYEQSIASNPAMASRDAAPVVPS